MDRPIEVDDVFLITYYGRDSFCWIKNHGEYYFFGGAQDGVTFYKYTGSNLSDFDPCLSRVSGVQYIGKADDIAVVAKVKREMES